MAAESGSSPMRESHRLRESGARRDGRVGAVEAVVRGHAPAHSSSGRTVRGVSV